MPNKTRPTQLMIFLLVTIFLLIVYGWGNLKCHGMMGGDNIYCYIPMASALLDDDPDTKYTTDYGSGRGVIFPLVYALAWKATYGSFIDFDSHIFANENMPNIVLLIGAFSVIFALFILLALILDIKHLLSYVIAIIFYLQVDPFFEILNNGFIDGFYFFISVVGMYFLVRGIAGERSKDFSILGVIWFFLPMVRANGLFLIMWTIIVLGITCLMHLKDKKRLIILFKQSLAVFFSFALCNIIYETLIFAIGWEPTYHVVRHHPLLSLVLPGISLHIYGMENAASLLNDFANVTSLTDLFNDLKNYFLSVNEHIHNIFNIIKGGILPNGDIYNYEHCHNTVLHLLHGNFTKFIILKFIIIVANITFIIYQFYKRHRVILIMYLGALCHLVVQSLAAYEARYYVFIFFLLFYPFFWSIDQMVGLTIESKKGN